MNIANQVKSLTEDIEASYGERMSWLADATKDTHQMMTRIGRENKEAADAVAKLLAHFRGDHKAMAKTLGSFLDESESTRIAEFKVSYAERMKWLADAIKDTHQIMNRIHGENKEAAEGVARLLSEFRKKQKELANTLAEFLSLSEKERLENFHLMDEEIKKSVSELREETKQIMERVRREIEEINAEVADLLSRFRKEHGEMSAELSRKLTEEEAERLEEFRAFFSDVQRRTAEILTATREDIKEARNHWQNLAKVMSAKRAGKSIPAPRAEMGVPTAVKEEAEEAFAGGELKERVLKVVQAHPGGIKLSKIGKALRIAYIQAAKPIKDLLAEVKVTKRGSKYLPA